MTLLETFITAARGAERLLADEIEALTTIRPTLHIGGVSFQGAHAEIYRVCAGSRIAERVLLHLATFGAADEEALYAGARTVPWAEHLDPHNTLAVRATTARSSLSKPHYVALKTKDAIVDTLRETEDRRPDIDPKTPDVQLHVRLHNNRATLSLELASRPRPKRSRNSERYPISGGLAAALLIQMGWPELAAQGVPCVDPFCGDGRLLLEAASMATHTLPERAGLGLLAWRGHDPHAWNETLDAFRSADRPPATPRILGFDPSTSAIGEAQRAIQRAHMGSIVRLEHSDIASLTAPAGPQGLVVTNPPYGQRLTEGGALGPVYAALGDALKHGFPGWTAGVLTGNALLSKRIGLKASERLEFYNGAVSCRLLIYPLRDEAPQREAGPGWRKPSPDAHMLVNRLRKNRTRIGRWARKNNITCYRLYDADIPEYNMAIDWYDGAVLIQEYQRPPRVDPEVAETHLSDALLVVPEILEIEPDDVSLRVRRRTKGQADQYTRHGEAHVQREVQEGGLTFTINLTDYLDTGLFLDQRLIRATIRTLAAERAFLNLYAYTCTATVYAADGGATHTTSVDLSQNYLNWGAQNLKRNGFQGHRHTLIRDDCMQWMAGQRDRRYGLIYAAPPTFSRSRRADTFDVQRDHVQLIRSAVRLLEPDGVLIFSNPFQDFVLDRGTLTKDGLHLTDITAAHVPKDFARTPHIFHAWRIERVPKP
ncbi:MAG: bifunctional 23S rRNA (guanine(2069)-N(7))-methyltransferase RlmK/23S rRNA (guanine(2445)-N(2))-methyltransferase RlmL [Myxococcota bacterium]